MSGGVIFFNLLNLKGVNSKCLFPGRGQCFKHPHIASNRCWIPQQLILDCLVLTLSQRSDKTRSGQYPKSPKPSSCWPWSPGHFQDIGFFNLFFLATAAFLGKRWRLLRTSVRKRWLIGDAGPEHYKSDLFTGCRQNEFSRIF